MNYLQMKKKAMLNYVSGSQPSVSIDIVTHSTGGTNASVDVTVDGVTTNYTYTQASNPIDLGIAYLLYLNGWQIVSKGNIEINGTSYSFFEKQTWAFSVSVDYTITGHEEYQPHNKVRVVTLTTYNRNSSVVISDEEENMQKVYNDSQTYSKAIQVYYQSGWKVKANQDVECNGATYHNGDMVEQWAYNATKDISITIL